MATQWGRKETIIWPPHVPMLSYTAVATALLCTCLFIWQRFTFSMTPLQRSYITEYIRSDIGAKFTAQESYRLLYLGGGKGKPRLAFPVDFMAGETTLPNGKVLPVALSDLATAQGYRWFYRGPEQKLADLSLNRWLRLTVFEDKGLLDLFAISFIEGGVCLAVMLWFAVPYDIRRFKQMKYGRILRGPQLLSPKEFNRAQKGDGIGFKTTELGKMMRIPSRKEAQHFQIMGDTGVGKTQLIVQMLCQIQERGESAIVYDPACEYLQRFYDKGRGDIVLNPLDERCPYWGPANEMASNAEADAIAASLYQPATDAKDEFDIRRNQLDLGTLAHIDAPGDPDMVLAQTPPPNAGVDQPRVNILLSSSNGAASSAFVMPSFIGMSVGSAYRTANALGLRIAILGEAPAESPVSPQSSPAPPAGPIAAQAPESGFRVTRGDTIHLTVAHAQPDATTATPQAPLPPPQ